MLGVETYFCHIIGSILNVISFQNVLINVGYLFTLLICFFSKLLISLSFLILIDQLLEQDKEVFFKSYFLSSHNLFFKFHLNILLIKVEITLKEEL